jgi:hypothetical protein
MTQDSRHALTALRRAAGRSALHVGLTETNWLALKTTRRPRMLWRSLGGVPGVALKWGAPAMVTSADVALCERLIFAFEAATSSAGPTNTTGPWAWVMDTHQHQLLASLQRHDPRHLAVLLSSMFRQELIWGLGGMAPGGMPDHSESRLGSRILLLKLVDSLVSLGEALGVVTVENPEQGYVDGFDPRRGGAIAELVAELERVIGISLSFPEIGAPYGLAVEGRLITAETPDQLYTAVRLREAVGMQLCEPTEGRLHIVEIGGGYGGACYWLLKCRHDAMRYTIVDLPTVNVLQGYFLAQALGPDAVSFFGEPRATVAIIPNHALAQVDSPYDVLLNKDSMPEMPYDTMVEYLSWARSGCRGFFYSNNHEAGAPFLEYSQGRVADAIREVGGFRRLAREQSWVRPGYVEEIYHPVPTSSTETSAAHADPRPGGSA